MKVLITGGSGQLGTSLQRFLRDKGYTVLAPEHKQMDITNADQVGLFFELNRPDAVIHCASYNYVDLAEKQIDVCRKINVYGTELIANECKKIGTHLIYTSSDYVFDGQKSGEYKTTDKKNPLSVYGQSKSDAEDIVLHADSQNAILRISWLFGPSKRNFIESILEAAKSKPSISVVEDQIGSPTFTDDLCDLIEQMLLKHCFGIYHGTNEGICSRAEFAQTILNLAHSHTIIKPISSEEYAAKARRPKNSCLSKKCLDESGIHRLPHWKNALERYWKTRNAI